MKLARRLAMVVGGLVLLAIVVGPAFLDPNPRLLPAATPESVGLGFESVEFQPPDVPLTLRAWWMPATDAKAALVMVHGGGEDNRSLPYGGGLALARDLVAHGYGVLAIDLRNYGESDASPEKRASFGVREANDVVGALDYLARRTPGTRHGAIGFSMGGSTVLYAAAKDPRLEAVVSDSAFAESRHVGAPFVRAMTGAPTWLLAPFLWSAEHLHGMELGAGRPIDVVAGIAPRHLLVVHDASDPIVPVADARRLAAACPGAEIWITDVGSDGSPFGTHIKAYSRDPSAYVTRVTRFLDATFASVSVSPPLGKPSDGRRPAK
jgi:pimeloyl-ACP methyl ester carboxylesterase